jgi:hypothetical protein
MWRGKKKLQIHKRKIYENFFCNEKKKNICDEKQETKKRCAHLSGEDTCERQLASLEHKKTRLRPNMKTQDKI